MAKVPNGVYRNIAENLNLLSRVNERYRRQADRQTTDARATGYSGHEREFTFAKNAETFYIYEFTSSSYLTFIVAPPSSADKG